MTMTEPAALLAQRIDTLISESERLETELLASGNDVSARDISFFTLELRLAKRTLASMLPYLDRGPTRPTLQLADRRFTDRQTS